MRFTSVGPKWRAALQSSLLSLSLPLPSPSCPLGYHPLLPSYRVRSLDRPSVRLSLSLFFSRSLGALAARRRLQECTKCTALTDTRPRSTASTCLLRPFASPCPFSLHLSLLVSPSRSFVSFFSGRLLRLRGPLSHPLHRSAAAAAAAAVAARGWQTVNEYRCW